MKVETDVIPVQKICVHRYARVIVATTSSNSGKNSNSSYGSDS